MRVGDVLRLRKCYQCGGTCGKTRRKLLYLADWKLCKPAHKCSIL